MTDMEAVAASARREREGLRVLLVEDNTADAELLVRHLRRAGFDPEWRRVDTEEDYREHLTEDLDLVLADYQMPQFSGLRALELLKESGLAVPFIIVSGSIGEEMAVRAMREGASDYLLKDRMARLGPAVVHALDQARLIRKHQRAEKELRESETLLRTINEASPLGIVVTDADGSCIYTNQAARRILGVGFQEAAGAGWSRTTHPDDYPGLQESWTAARVRAERYESTHRCLRAGEVAWVNLKVAPMRDNDRVFGFVGAVEDITERKQASEVLAASERRFREMLANVDFIAMTLDEKGRITFCNDALLRTTGWTREEVHGADWFATFVPGDEALKALFFEALAAGTIASHHENAIRTKQGELRDIAFNNTTLWDAAGRVVGTASIGEDVTERKRTEKRVREQAEMLDRAHEAIIVREIETRRISFWNKGAERLYGWTAAEAIGRDIGELIFTDPGLVSIINAKLLEADEWRGESQHVTRAGRKLVVSGHVTLIRDAEGRAASALVINIDITEQKNLESQMLRAQRMESIGTLASGVAHDLNNILAPILMSAPLLQQDLPADQREMVVSAILTSAERGADIVKQVLAFGRGLEGKRALLSPRGIVNELAKIMAQTFPKEIRIESTVPRDLWLVNGDATQIHQVLLNLCVNARDAMPDGGTLRLRAGNLEMDESFASMIPEASPGPHVMLEVADTGTGMPPGVQERIFEPFFTTKPVGKGTGLGLSTVVGIIKSHGGCLRVESAPGKGTTFAVYLPAEKEARASDLEKEREAPPVGRGELVLVVDDEKSILAVARGVLESHGYRTLLAADGTEALAIFAQREQEIDAVLTDVLMPFMDGVTLVRALRRLRPQLPVIASTGQRERARLAELQALGVGAVLEKPYSADALLRLLHETLGPGREETAE